VGDVRDCFVFEPSRNDFFNRLPFVNQSVEDCVERCVIGEAILVSLPRS
jgi:hypothetical protein